MLTEIYINKVSILSILFILYAEFHVACVQTKFYWTSNREIYAEERIGSCRWFLLSAQSWRMSMLNERSPPTSSPSSGVPKFDSLIFSPLKIRPGVANLVEGAYQNRLHFSKTFFCIPLGILKIKVRSWSRPQLLLIIVLFLLMLILIILFNS